jgi:hypothetical protein
MSESSSATPSVAASAADRLKPSDVDSEMNAVAPRYSRNSSSRDTSPRCRTLARSAGVSAASMRWTSRAPLPVMSR